MSASSSPRPDGFDLFTLGEVMLRFSPPGYTRLEDSPILEFRTGGAEANVAVALQRLGMRSLWCGKLPEGPLGRAAERRIRGFGVETSVVWSSSARMGLYFIEPAAAPRTAAVLYDRAGSAASTLQPDEVDWSLLHRCRHVHLTGITAALSPSSAATALRAAEEARAHGLSVSFDTNYRARLWSPAAAREGMLPFLQRADLVICPSADAATVFGLGGSPREQLTALGNLTPAPWLALTCGGDGALLWNRTSFFSAEPFPVQAVDRIGAGDAFDAGLIWGYLQGDVPMGLRYGLAMAALKHTFPGDEFVSTRAEVEALLHSGHRDIQR